MAPHGKWRGTERQKIEIKSVRSSSFPRAANNEPGRSKEITKTNNSAAYQQAHDGSKSGRASSALE
ncbi:septin Spn5 [Anopheles sinensis]|uniref:Septin Spn5 n=1 Tax=Anopheles sinensis TaxID=74873 RepID=A0A084VJG6_ANOSI|nr:septin Spn5 [Anopheles sinensis]